MTNTVKAQVLLRTKRAGKLHNAGDIIEITQDELKASPHLFCAAEEFQIKQEIAKEEAEKAAKVGSERHRFYKAAFQQAARAAAEAQAISATNQAERAKALAEQAQARAKKAADLAPAQVQKGRKSEASA